MGGRVSEAQEVRVSRLSSLGLGLLAVLSGILFEKLNIAFLVGLTFGIAASCNFPDLIPVDVLERVDAKGAVWGGLVGLVTATAIVIFSKAVWVTVLGNPAPLFPYEQPACSRCAFCRRDGRLGARQEPRAAQEIEAYGDQMVRAQTGFGAAGAASH